MENHIVVIKVGNREDSAVEVQKILTEYGRQIKVRLGLHDFESASSKGLILLQVLSREAGDEIQKKLANVSDITVKLLDI